jgi:outer membrane protein
MFRVLTIALFAPAALAAQMAADTTPRAIALTEAVDLAQRNSPLTVQARGELRSSRAGVRSSYLAFLPAVGVSMGSSWAEGHVLGDAGNLIPFTGSTSYSDGIGASIELFDGGRRFFDIRSARSRFDAAEATDVLQHYQVALDVKQQYFEVLAAREAEAAARAQLAEAEQQLRVSTVRVRAGAAMRSDSLRSVVTVGNARLAILDAENRIQVANASLTRLVGTPFTVTAHPDDSVGTTLEPPDPELLARLAEAGPVVQQATAQLSVEKALARAARAPYLPRITASFNRGANGFDRRFGFGDTFAYSNSFRVSLNYQLFDQLQREEQVIRANVAEANAEAALRDSQLRVRQELAQALGLLRNAGQRVAVQLVSVAATEEDLRFQQQRYALGAATLLDVLTSQSQLNQARNALIAARFDQRVAGARLEALVGRPLGAPN